MPTKNMPLSASKQLKQNSWFREIARKQGAGMISFGMMLHLGRGRFAV
jgi:hypothetical protein